MAEGEFDAVARLNNDMGRNASLPLRGGRTSRRSRQCLGRLAAALERSRYCPAGVVGRPPQRAVAATEEGREASLGPNSKPRIFARAAIGNTRGKRGHGLAGRRPACTWLQPLYAGGQLAARELQSGRRGCRGGAPGPDARSILDAISLQVQSGVPRRDGNQPTHRSSRASRHRSGRRKLLRCFKCTTYRNGNATPTDIVDSEAALTRAQQRFFSAIYTYLAGARQVDTVTGQRCKARHF